ncbi:MAG: DUF6702 family protein [Cyclobacteriaceae bacterium]|jgi:hypothetical protein
MLLSILLSWIINLHPIHLSVTEVNYSEKDKTFQITSRIFIDDLELSVRALKKENELNLLEPDKGRKTDDLVSEYLIRHLKVKIDGKPVVLNYLGSEVEDVALICYIESPVIKKFRTIEVWNDVIQETHADQSNLVHVSYRGQIKSARLMRENPSESFTFANN